MSAMISRRGEERGQGLVEFALVLPVFFFILCGLFDAGRYVYMNSVLSQASREGARLASVEASWIGSADPSCNTAGGPVCPANAAALQADVLAAVNRMVAPFGPVASANVVIRCDASAPPTTNNWAATTCDPLSNAQPQMNVSVRVTLTFSPITPVVSGMKSITTSGLASMVIN
jgi:Flp pilus assembly protein TadG